jgi:hypothetical protein
MARCQAAGLLDRGAMDRISLFRCDLCHHPVDAELRARARRGWQPLIICDRCIRRAADVSRPTAGVASSAG